MIETNTNPTRTRNHPSLSAAASRSSLAQRHARTLPARMRAAGAILVVLLAGLAISLSAVGNPASPNIRLEVHDHASSGSDGFTDTTASNGATYSYRYSGGEGNGGNVVFRTRGRVTVNVRLVDGSNYAIDDVMFTGDIHNQLSWVSSGHAASHAVIQDKNDQLQTAQYKITVHDKNANVSIPCDPIIANRG